MIWTPAKEFLIGIEALYFRVDQSQRVALPLRTAVGDLTGIFRSI
ncbi:hypothetical protein [Microvirga arvi]|nr:hypothetical protein [Microvirga arvi]